MHGRFISEYSAFTAACLLWIYFGYQLAVVGFVCWPSIAKKEEALQRCKDLMRDLTPEEDKIARDAIYSMDKLSRLLRKLARIVFNGTASTV